MIIEKKCPNCGKTFKTIDKFPDKVCEPCFDDHIEIMICDHKDCSDQAFWEVGFSSEEGFWNTMEFSGDNDYQQKFCDNHFLECGICMNAAEFREINAKEWIDISTVDLILHEFVEKRKKND